MKKKFRFKFIPQNEKPEKLEFLAFRIGKILPIATVIKTIDKVEIEFFCEEDVECREEIQREFEGKYGCS